MIDSYSVYNYEILKLPSRATFTKRLDEYANKEENKFRNDFFSNVNDNKIAITTDISTSKSNKAYMAITGHFIDNDWKLYEECLDIAEFPPEYGSHTGKSIMKLLRETLYKFSLNDKVCINDTWNFKDDKDIKNSIVSISADCARNNNTFGQFVYIVNKTLSSLSLSLSLS